MIKGKVYTQNLYTEEELLKNHVCMIPFKHMEMFKDKATLCCGTWLKKELVYPKDENGEPIYPPFSPEPLTLIEPQLKIELKQLINEVLDEREAR